MAENDIPGDILRFWKSALMQYKNFENYLLGISILHVIEQKIQL